MFTEPKQRKLEIERNIIKNVEMFKCLQIALNMLAM